MSSKLNIDDVFELLDGNCSKIYDSDADDEFENGLSKIRAGK